MYSAHFGVMPEKAAGGYLDKTFSRMMWFKMVCVYVAVAAGYDVLFQDVDLIWLKDPIPALREMPGNNTNAISYLDFLIINPSFIYSYVYVFYLFLYLFAYSLIIDISFTSFFMKQHPSVCFVLFCFVLFLRGCVVYGRWCSYSSIYTLLRQQWFLLH